MIFKAKVEVEWKPGVLDPEAQATKKGLELLDFSVISVKMKKIIEVTFEADTRAAAESMVEDMCRKLLVNEVLQRFSFVVEESG